MIHKQSLGTGIPVSTSLESTLEAAHMAPGRLPAKKRLLYLSGLSVILAAVVAGVARLLVYLINGVTQLAFYGNWSVAPASPVGHALGPWVIGLPALGGLAIGLMALYGSKAIRGHGIPEAMEQILTNESRIKPAIAFLKPVSAAISIGTGGPFGAEGPIIATGGALGSTFGQLIRVSQQERKILLAAGATAGMSAIFGTPIAAIFLAVELLLFEFSAESMLPVALACITGAAGHYLLFESGPVFPMPAVQVDGPNALFAFSVLGLMVGFASVLVTRAVYLLEDWFERLPIHWMWWPAIGGLVVGGVGYFYPQTLGVGYNNITDLLSGSLPLKMIGVLCVFKFLSWVVALSSGTSGGTLAPLLTIGGALGAALCIGINHYFPSLHLPVPMGALVGMSAMFAGASRALLTSIVFAVESTGQTNALLVLLAASTGAYMISLWCMNNTIMTEKIARRGVNTPVSYRPDILEQLKVKDVMQVEGNSIDENLSIGEVRNWLTQFPQPGAHYFILTGAGNVFSGILSGSNLFSEQHPASQKVGSLVRRKLVWLREEQSLRTAVETMLDENVDMLPVLNEKKVLTGIVSYRNVVQAYQQSKAANLPEDGTLFTRKKQKKKGRLTGSPLV